MRLQLNMLWRLIALAAIFQLPPADAADTSASPATHFDLNRADIRDFIHEVAVRDDLNPRIVRGLLRHAVPQVKVIERTEQPAERVLAWWEYRAHFVTEKRIAAGVDFWLEHRELLERIAAERGVPPEYIVSILGCETFYGRMTGHDRVLDALMTLAFGQPVHSKLARSELEQFILLTREQHIDPLMVTGSYAGAMGAPQFMPSSYRKFAVDADGGSHIDLWNDWADIFASVANFLREHGWEPATPVMSAAIIDAGASFHIDLKNLDLNETLGDLNAQGVESELPQAPDTQVILVSAEEHDGPAYRLGFKNFQVITRYNHSARYAMAVHDLAQAIKARVSEATASAPP
jgi:membrane-bound lytic murein transglycosylase B